MNIAARHMLPLEIALAALILPTAVSILTGTSTIWSVIHALGPWAGLSQTIWWGVPMLVLALSLLALACYEWRHGREWGELEIRTSADLRCTLALLLAVCHVAILSLLVLAGHTLTVFSVTTQAPIFVGLLGWCAFKTRRLSVALNPEIPTPGLDEQIRREFGRGLRDMGYL